jgi:NAD+ synthase
MPGLPSIAIAQINPVVGNILGNSAKILQTWESASARGAQLVVFPELCVTGYSPEDLVLMPDFRKQAMHAVYDIAEKTSGGAAVILGCLWEQNVISSECEKSLQNKNTSSDGISHCIQDEKIKIFNAALLIDGGEILHVQPKTILPNYGVFDEKRVFSKGEGTAFVNWRGYNIAILICEDVWDSSLTSLLGGHNADAVFVINASPFEVGKHERRLQVAGAAARMAGAPLFYANMAGGQDDVVFDGGSFALNPAGQVVCGFPRFEENIAIISHLLPEAEISQDFRADEDREIWSAMKLGLRDYVAKNGFSHVLLGLSGGIDSAVSAALAVDALGAENVLGVLLPSPFTSPESIEDALLSASLLNIKTLTIPITEPMEMFEGLLTPEFALGGWMEKPEIGGNLQARLRAVILMALSNRYGGLLLSTGNKSEIAVGYSTLYGDSCGGYNVLKDIYKTKIYTLANWRNGQSPAIPERSISKPPSAELRPGQRDDDQLPPYPVLDNILMLHIEGRLSAREIIEAGHEPEIVGKILRLVRLSEYKRRQSCPGVKISSMLFGKDRRYPITNKF